MLCRALLTGLFAVAITGDVAAQATTRVSPGDRVRITTTGSEKSPQVVTVSQVDSSALLVISRSGELHQIPVGSIKRLDLRLGRSSRGESALRGAGIGFVVGGTFGAGLGLITGGDCGPNSFFCYSRGEGAAILGLVLGAAGATAGVILGAISPGDNWQRIEWASSVSIAPQTGGGVGVGYAKAF